MSHAAYASPLVLEPGVSRYLILYLIVIHTLALAVVAAPLNIPVALCDECITRHAFIAWSGKPMMTGRCGVTIRLNSLGSYGRILMNLSGW